jgi:hypothetical protein
MSEFIIFLIGSSLFYLSYFVLGIFIYEKFYTKIVEINFLETTLIGLLSISYIALIINFFTPLSPIINLILLLINLCLIFFIKEKKIFLILKYILIFIFSLLIFTVYARNPEDASLYHLSYIAILNSEPINFGLTNFHSRFGHTSITQYLSAISYIPIISKHTIISQNNFIYCLVIAIFFSKIKLNIEKNETYNLYFKFLCLIFISLKLAKFSDWGNDLTPAILTFYIVSFLMDFLTRYNNEYRFNFIYFYILLIITFIFLNKISYIILYSLVLLLYLKNIRIIKFFNHKIIIFFIIFLLIFFIRNLIISSCIIYPLTFTCLETPWNSNELNNLVFLEAKSWAMGISDQQNLNLSPEIFVKDFNWVNTWVNNHFIKVNEKIFTFLIFSFLILLILKFKLKTQNTKINLPNFHKYILLLFLIYVIFWFLSSPLFRYGTGLIVVLVILIINPLVLRYFNYVNNNLQILKIFMIFLIITTIIVKNIIRISNDIGNDLIPKTFDNISLNQLKFNNIEVFYNNGSECYYPKNSPCLKHKPNKIKNILYYLQYKIYLGK